MSFIRKNICNYFLGMWEYLQLLSGNLGIARNNRIIRLIPLHEDNLDVCFFLVKKAFQDQLNPSFTPGADNPRSLA